MLSGILRGPHGQDNHGVKPVVHDPVVREVVPSPEDERADPVQTSAKVAAPAHMDSLTVQTKSVPPKATRVSSGLGFVREQHLVIRQRCHHELGANVPHHMFDTSFSGLLEWIRTERLTRLPHKGGAWDKVLISAHFFADQVNGFRDALEIFVPEVSSAASLVYGHCLLLLELGHENAAALDKAFGLFYQFGLELSVLLKRANHFRTSRTVEEHLGHLVVDLMNIVTGVAIAFYSAAHGRTSHAKIDIYATFASSIENFRSRRMRTATEMWNHSLVSARIDDECEIDTIRKWLAPKDSVLAFLASNHINLTARREEYTCMWFHHHLASFLRGSEKILTIEGKSGSGKTTLAGWTVDRLQRKLGQRSFSTLSVSVNPSIASQSTSLALVKTLIYQLVEQRIGDVQLYKVLRSAFEATRNKTKLDEYEAELWSALDKALGVVNSAKENTVVVLDGVDEIVGQKPAAQAVCKKLHGLAHKYGHLRLIQLSAPLNMTVANSRYLSLTSDYNGDDTRSILHQSLMKHAHFQDRNHPEQESIIERLAVAAGDSMLWATLACDYLRLQASHSAVTDAVGSLEACTKGTEDILHKLIPAMKLNTESRNLLACLVACNRPLSLAEAKILMQVQTDRGVVLRNNVDVKALVKSLGALAIVGEGLVCIRHESIKQQLIMLSAQNRVSLQLTHRHKELATRLFIYAKSCLNEEYDASLEGLDVHVTQHLFGTHKLLEYTIRNWVGHFKRSSWYKSTGSFEHVDELRGLFPSSIAFAILERSCWTGQLQAFDNDAFDCHKEAFRLRGALFDDNYSCLLQSALSCAFFSERLSYHSESVSFYCRAMKISKIVIGVQASITVTCGQSLLRLSEGFVSKTRTEIMTFREEALLILVSAYKHIHGATSVMVLEIYKKLAALYVFIGEETRAHEIFIIIRQITIHVYGAGSDEAEAVSRDLSVDVKKHKHVDMIDTFEHSIFGSYEEEAHELFDITRVDIIIRLCAELVVRGEFSAAEEKYIELWLRIGEQCKSGLLIWHEKKIQVLIAYARFLHTCKRTREASSVLICIWREYEHHECSSSRTIIVLLREVATCMKIVGLYAVALGVFKKCWSWFKSTRSETHEFTQIEEEITTVTKKIIETTTTTTTTSETTIREVFESSFSSTTEITSTTVELCKSLTSIYIEQKRYSEARAIIKTVLRKSWSSFFSASFASLTLASKFSMEMIEMVTRLAICYVHEHKFEKAEEIYLRLFISIRSSKRCDDALFIRYSEILIAFYKEHQYHDRLISFYQSLLVSYRAFYGVTHSITIRMLYTIGALCRTHYRTHGYWLEYYVEIVTALNKGMEICHEDALEALLIVAECYYEDRRYSECLHFYKLISATFFKLGVSCRFFKEASFVLKIISCHFRCLELTQTDIEIQISIFKSYREHCIKYFSATSSIAIEVTLQLATIYCRSEKYEFHSIELYEFVLKHSSSTEVITRTKQTLKSLYIKKVTSKKTTTTVTKETIETTTKIVHETYTETRKKYGCIHKSTWSHFQELVMLYHSFQMTELAIKELRSFVVECFSSTTITSKEMVETAKFIAEVYVACGFVEHGFELIHELKMQIICKSTLHVGHCGFNLTGHGREWFVFIASFQSCLHFELSFTQCLAEIVAEALYYERFTMSLKQSTEFKVVMFAAARLRSFLYARKRTAFFITIEQGVYEAFIKHNGSIMKGCSDASVQSFTSVLLEYFSEHLGSKRFVYSAGWAATERVRLLIKEKKHKAAYELANCTHRYLMAREGLDDPSEIGLGFQLCLLMAGRGTTQAQDASLRHSMLELSRKILGEVLDICDKYKINLAQLKLTDLDDLICLMGEQKDYQKLQKLLYTLWMSRESQPNWSEGVKLSLARRLIEARFVAGERALAIRLCEDIVYNVRRVHGTRHAHTLQFVEMLGRLYTSTALHYAAHPANDKNAQALAKAYFKKAMGVHEDALKQFVEGVRGGYDSEDDEDLDSEISSNAGQGSPDGKTSRAQQLEQEGRVRQHVVLLKRAFQRLGGWSKAAEEYEVLTERVQEVFGGELKMQAAQVQARQWSAKSFGGGKAEGDEDVFVAPKSWTVVSN